MSSDAGFKRIIPQSLKLSTISVNNSTDIDDSPPSNSKRLTFDMLKKKLGVDYLAEVDHMDKSLMDWPDNKSKTIEKKSTRKKYNTKRVHTRPVKFVYVYKKIGFSNQDSGSLFKDLIKLVN